VYLPLYKPPELAKSAPTHEKDQEAQRDEQVMADADVAIGGGAFPYLVAKETSALGYDVAQEANHCTYFLRSGGCPSFLCYNGKQRILRKIGA